MVVRSVERLGCARTKNVLGRHCYPASHKQLSTGITTNGSTDADLPEDDVLHEIVLHEGQPFALTPPRLDRIERRRRYEVASDIEKNERYGLTLDEAEAVALRMARAAQYANLEQNGGTTSVPGTAGFEAEPIIALLNTCAQGKLSHPTSPGFPGQKGHSLLVEAPWQCVSSAIARYQQANRCVPVPRA